MKKIQINSEQEYRQFAFPLCKKYDGKLDSLFGLNLIRECWDTDNDGNNLDEQGNIIPDDSPENVKVQQWVKDLKYPIIVCYWIESGFDRTSYFISSVNIVSKYDFI